MNEIERERRLASACVVYYARRSSDGMIKIGYTTWWIESKLKELSREHGELQLMLTHSGRNRERLASCERFADCRDPDTGLFNPSLPLLRWIYKTRQIARYSKTQHPDVLPLKELAKLIGPAAPALNESHYRDILARQVGGRTEVTLPFGRADVMTDTTVWEVEPVGRWRQGVAQALQYAAQVPQRGAVAIYGKDVPLADIRRMVGALPPPGLEVWWLAGEKFVRALYIGAMMPTYPTLRERVRDVLLAAGFQAYGEPIPTKGTRGTFDLTSGVGVRVEVAWWDAGYWDRRRLLEEFAYALERHFRVEDRGDSLYVEEPDADPVG